MSSIRTKYPFTSRAIHWLLARMGLVQTFLLFLWMAERSQNTTEPPIKPWIIYVHATIGLVGSTGLSARFLPRLALFGLTLAQLHMAYIYLFESKLAYSQWLRTRVALRTIASAAVYLRILGVEHVESGPNNPAKSEQKYSTCYVFGLTLLSIFTALTGLLSLPPSLVPPIHSEAQNVELSSTWPLLEPMEPWLGCTIGMLLLIASILHTTPFLVTPKLIPNDNRLAERLLHWADRFTLYGIGLLLICRDSHVAFWMTSGCEYWLQVHLILNSFILMAGIYVTSDLISHGSKTIKCE